MSSCFFSDNTVFAANWSISINTISPIIRPFMACSVISCIHSLRLGPEPVAKSLRLTVDHF